MCIIAIKNKGKEMFPAETVQAMFENNPDGAGYMYALDGKVHIRKGFMTLAALNHDVKNLEKSLDIKSVPMVFHFRISTAGLVDAGNCHPYPVTSDRESMRETVLETDLGVAHNGVLGNYSPKDGKYNDSQCFTSDVLSVFKDLNSDFIHNEKIMKIIEELIGGSRFAFLDSQGAVARLGNWIEEDGYWYSNTSYISRRTQTLALNDYYVNQTYEWPTFYDCTEEDVKDYDLDFYMEISEELEEKIEKHEFLDGDDTGFIIDWYQPTKAIYCEEDDGCEIWLYEIKGRNILVDMDYGMAFYEDDLEGGTDKWIGC